jgi:hypothetical protein
VFTTLTKPTKWGLALQASVREGRPLATWANAKLGHA